MPCALPCAVPSTTPFCTAQFGFIPWFSSSVVDIVSGLGLTWQPAFGVILVLYFYSHYFFASGAAHIGAMYTAFLAVARACGTPAMLAALALGQVGRRG